MTTLNDDELFEVINGKQVLRDGKKLTVGIHLMDAALADDGRLHRPGQRTSNDAAGIERRDTAYSGYLKDLGDGWRTPDPPPVAAEARQPIADASTSAHTEMVNDLEGAWKGAA